MTDKYYIKENYVTRNPEPEKWISHPNGNILNIYSEIIRGNVLDFGCNHGACSYLICSNKNVKSITGLDLNQEAIKVAENTKTNYPNCDIKFICENILNTTLTQSFDTIVSFHTLEHIYPEDVNSVLSKLYDSLTYDGYFIISIPYDHAFDDGTQHVAFYNEASLSKLFEENKFTTIECLNDNRHSESGILTGIFKKEFKVRDIIGEITNSSLDNIIMNDYRVINNLEYQDYYKSPSSLEHYRLLRYLSNRIGDSTFIDIGTLKGSSALALSSNKTNTVYSFNLSNELQLNEIPNNVIFVIDDIMDEQYKEIILNSKIILLDTFHDGTFEKMFYTYLKKINYKGTLLLDDIKLNQEMVDFWDLIELEKEDITRIGHVTGTGVVYFN
jgi:2-polyprenyl-3-methyl-5-hydroxy-6-metoxy-1,4-benzoquinol methylase